MFSVKKDPRSKMLYAEILANIENGSIKNKNDLEREKILLAKKHGVFTIVKNVEIIEYAREHGKEDLVKYLKMKPVRTLSGVANIAVMWKGHETGNKFYSCSGQCIYCPQGEDSPKAYTGVEPTTMRARRFDYDPYRQIENRLKQFHIMGHSTDKCELIIMGGTITSMPPQFQESFIKRCFDAFNEDSSDSLEDAQRKNESARNRCVGLTVETRADYFEQKHIENLMRFGCTRIELGIQTTSDKLLEKINRGHDSAANVEAIKRLKSAGLKFTAHWMPGLTGLEGEPDIKEELRMFEMLFTPDYQPDELKIYPVLVMPGTKLYDLWRKGKYMSLEKEKMIELLAKMKEAVPPYVRIKRVMRDISEHVAEAGTKTTNLRQLVKEMMIKSGRKCRCIRCREIGLEEADPDVAKLSIQEYEASGGKEFFVSFETADKILGFLRLRIDNERAKIRELHVYGEMSPIGKKIAYQHSGLGSRLMKKAEEIAIENQKKSIAVTSGVGVRNYYRNLGYVLEGNYMVKKLG